CEMHAVVNRQVRCALPEFFVAGAEHVSPIVPHKHQADILVSWTSNNLRKPLDQCVKILVRTDASNIQQIASTRLHTMLLQSRPMSLTATVYWSKSRRRRLWHNAYALFPQAKHTHQPLFRRFGNGDNACSTPHC